MPSRVSGGPSTVPLSWAATAVKPWLAQDVQRRAVGGEGQPLHHVGDGPLVQGRGQEQLAQDVAAGLRPEVALLGGVHARGEEVPGEPARTVEGLGGGQRVPPHLALGVRDLLRVHRPGPSDARPCIQRGGKGITGCLVGGQQDRTGRVEDGGDRQRGGLARARRHDRHGNVLVPHAHLVLRALEVAQEDAGVVGVDVLGVFEARAQRAGFSGDRLGQQRLDVGALGHALDALLAPAAGALVPLVEHGGGDTEGEQHSTGQDACTEQEGRFSQVRPELLGVQEGLNGLVGSTGPGVGRPGGELSAEPGEIGQGNRYGEHAKKNLEGDVRGVGGLVGGGLGQEGGSRGEVGCRSAGPALLGHMRSRGRRGR